jgi:hypothetical protein
VNGSEPAALERSRPDDRAAGMRFLSVEARLLLATSALDPDEGELGFLARGSPNWERLLVLAQRERSLPAAWRSLAPVVQGHMPAEVVEAFDRAAARSELYLNVLHQRLVDALGVLEAAGIEVLLLKGAALAHQGGLHFTEWPMGDLDLLVRPNQARRAWSLLADSGWRWNAEVYPAERYERLHHFPPLEDAIGTGAVLEVHAFVMQPGHAFRFGWKDLWAAAREVRVQGRRAFVPLPVPHLVHVCIHFAWSHQLERGTWRTFRDVDTLRRMDAFGWDAFVAMARKTGAERCSFWTLRLAREMAGIPVPGWVLGELRPTGLPEAVLDALGRSYALGLLAGESGCPSFRLRRLLWRIGVQPRRDERAPWPAEARGDDLVGKLARHGRGRAAWLAYVRSVLGARGS